MTTPTPRPPQPKYQVRANDGPMQGIEAALTLAIFLGLGWLLDRWLGTQPLFMIVLPILAAVAVGVRTWAQYTQRMEQLEAERLGRAQARREATR